MARDRTHLAALGAALVLALAASGCSGTADTGESGSAAPDTGQATANAEFTVSSPAFEDGAAIPVQYCLEDVGGGANESIPIEWSGAPSQTASFVVTVIDTHPIADSWVHWAVTGIPADTSGLEADASGGAMPSGSVELENTFGTTGYGGPAPPPGSGDHDYVITVYALDTDTIDIPDQPTVAEIESALEGHVLASASMTGTFGR